MYGVPNWKLLEDRLANACFWGCSCGTGAYLVVAAATPEPPEILVEAVQLIDRGPFCARKISSGPSLVSRFALGKNVSRRNSAKKYIRRWRRASGWEAVFERLTRPQRKWTRQEAVPTAVCTISRLPWDALLMYRGHVDVELCMLPAECPHLRFLPENGLEPPYTVRLTGCIANTLYSGW